MRGGGKVAKAVKPSGAPKTRTPLTPEARENQMISLAMDLAEQQLRDGTASSQLITEFVKRGSTKARIEKELLEKQRDLAAAKADAIKAADRLEELMKEATKAMRRYQGMDEEEEDFEDDDEEDEEDDETLRARLLEQTTEKAFAGNVIDYKNKTKEINGVGAVKVTPIWNRTRNSKTYNIK